MATKKSAPPVKGKPAPAPMPPAAPMPVTLPASKLTICQYGFAFVTLRGQPSKVKVAGNSNPNVTPHPSTLPGGMVVVIMAGQNTGNSVITITGLLWTPTGKVPFTQRITVSVVACPQPVPPPPPPPPPDPPVVGPDVPKGVCAGMVGNYTLNILLNGARVGLVHVSVVSSDPSVAVAGYEPGPRTVDITGVSVGTATITVSGEAEGVNFNVPFVQKIVVTVKLC